MNWLRVNIDLKRLDPLPIEQALFDLGAVSVELSDAADDPILEPAPGATPLWPTLYMSALFDGAVEDTDIRLTVAAAIEAGTIPAMRFEPVADRDWVGNWQQSLQPLRFGRDLWICPAGSTGPDKGGITIELEPGLAFGSGSHPTTALCLAWLANSSDRSGTLLDYGCGSGILSIAAVALGADRVVAVDLDSQALRATRDNAARNNVSERIAIVAPEAANHEHPFDRIVANILSGTLIELADELQHFCRTGTRIAMSGILSDQTESVTAAYGSWIRFEPPTERDDWILLTGTVTAA